jgi:hypothetical protein
VEQQQQQIHIKAQKINVKDNDQVTSSDEACLELKLEADSDSAFDSQKA